MQTKRIRIIIDSSMLVLLPFLMSYTLFSEVLHEYIGILMFVIFILHNLININWWKKLFIGPYPLSRIILTIINLMLVIIMFALPISGMLMSNYATPFFRVYGISMYVRMMHLCLAYWGLVLMSLHLGMNAPIFINKIAPIVYKITNDNKETKRYTLIGILISIYGVYSIVECKIIHYMFLRVPFVFYVMSKGLFIYLLRYIAIILTFAYIGYYSIKYMRKSEKNKLNKIIKEVEK